ncbi:MAG: 3-deoxy-D-manno-octulosonic acid transferase [Pseudomonadota bacterium]
MPRLYSALLTILTPLALARLWWKGRANPAYRERWKERLGHIPDLPARPRLWVHAVSVGETIAAAPLVRSWMTRHPDWAVLVTTTTPTGSAQVRRLFGDTVEHVYLPYDLPGAVRRFFGHAHPTLGIVMETELWPHLFAEAGARSMPLVLANARLSERSMRGYAKVGGLVRSTLRHLSLIAARGPDDAERFIELGAHTGNVEAVGNLKFDLDLPPEVRERGQGWRSAVGADRPVWIAASTHPGEEEVVLEAHRAILAIHPDALLLLAPRHPERANEIARMIESQGFGLVRRSTLAPSPSPFALPSLLLPASMPETPSNCGHREPKGMGGGSQSVFMIDTLGELMDFYAASDVAFVGGSLVAHGGHNPLEPAALGLPVLTGPHVFNFTEIYDAMLPTGAARKVANAEALAATLAELLGDAGCRQTMGATGRAWMATHRGALGRLIERMEALL